MGTVEIVTSIVLLMLLAGLVRGGAAKLNLPVPVSLSSTLPVQEFGVLAGRLRPRTVNPEEIVVLQGKAVSNCLLYELDRNALLRLGFTFRLSSE
ncbi:MAG: hypothetical protein ACLFPW_00325 [Spirochaetaceae bacterium]